MVYKESDMAHDDQQYCERCGKPVKPGTLVMLEMDQYTTLMHPPGEIPEERSQGSFPFGADCARIVLSHGGKWEKAASKNKKASRSPEEPAPAKRTYRLTPFQVRMLNAAPDLYAVAKFLVDVDEAWERHPHLRSQRPTIAGIVDAARAALAKAQGGAR